jgi:SPP1 gp7 family putative phage head morphogenesis protein
MAGTDLKFLTEKSYRDLRRVLADVRRRMLEKITELPAAETKKLKWMRGAVAEVDRLIDGERRRLPSGKLLVTIPPLAKQMLEELPLVRIFETGVRDGMDQLGIYRQFPLIDKPALAFVQDYTYDQITGLSEDVRQMIKSQIRLGIIQGEGVPELAKRLVNEGLPKGVFDKVGERADMIARTELARAHTEGRRAYYNQAGVEWVRVIGKNPGCPICGQHIGQIYSIKDAPRIPFHPNCECDIEAVLAIGGEQRLVNSQLLMIGGEIVVIGSEIWRRDYAPRVI